MKLLSLTFDRALPGYGMLLKGVLMSELVARWRVTVSAATKPPGVNVMPLNLIEAGPSSEPPWPPPAFEVVAATLFTVEVSAALLDFSSATLEVSVASLDLTSVDVFTASTALVEASEARALAAAAASRASSICLSRLLSSSFNSSSCSCCACMACLSSSSSAAISASVFVAFLAAALGLAGSDDFGAGASASFGESAYATPEVRNSDNTSAASFLIASLFYVSKFRNSDERDTGKLVRFTPREKVYGVSYSLVTKT